jgi:class 3 adenylate cyclase/tetratricopeptide (TPR) repeat protein
MANCPSCGHDNPAAAKFCMECAAPLAPRERVRASERRVVTVLFCDLVGFTSRSEVLDPEDVREFLVPYFELLVDEVGRHGGVIDKFTGDGAMAVFGVPTAHEDDPERAIRMGLRVLELLPELGLDLHARIGINTGEVLFAVDAYGQGDVVTGDAANTAKRIEGLAPTDGIFVGERTRQATREIFDFEELEPAAVKGKAEPLRVFRVVAPKARFGPDLIRTRGTTFVGREAELTQLIECFDEVLAERSPRLVTVVGEPGLGKSRIVAELFASLAERPQVLITWRQGRCLPYGEGITFWPLGEIVKAHAGILDTDPPDVAEQKLAEVLPAGGERAWLLERLRPLLGLEAAAAGREELFAAWTRLLEHIASQGPAVLVFEDLHWADDAMVAFLEHVAGQLEAVPLLLVGTARPELGERHPELGRDLDAITRIDLAPLSEAETGRLVSALLDAVMVPAEVQQPILDRAGGNPLFAEEFVRLLRDQGLIERRGASWELATDGELPLPESVQALIAARLDLLPTDAKAMLADAAVVGKVFWAGAIAHMGDRDRAEVQHTLVDLARRELLRPAQRSSIQGEAEYAFWHALVRDVAYGQLPRRARATRHAAAAAWIVATVGERVDELAGILAHHYSTARELARAARDDAQVAELEAPALKYLTLAGERALGLDRDAALAYLERALALAPAGHPERPNLLLLFARVVIDVRTLTEGSAALQEAIEAFDAQSDVLGATRVKAFLAMNRGDRTALLQANAEVLALLEPLGPSPELVEALIESGFDAALVEGKPEKAVTLSDRALEVAECLGLPRPGDALGIRGMARWDLVDEGGFQDMLDALELFAAAGRGDREVVWSVNLGIRLATFEGPAAALEVLEPGAAKAAAYGVRNILIGGLIPNMIWELIDLGELGRARSLLPDALRRTEEMEFEGYQVRLRWVEAWLHVLDGTADEAVPWLDWLEEKCHDTGLREPTMHGLGGAALLRARLGEDAAAVALLEEVEAFSPVKREEDYTRHLPAFVRTALQLGQPELAERLAEGCEFRTPRCRHAQVAVNAALAEARADLDTAMSGYADAARRWAGFGMVVEEAYALLGEGRCRVRLSRPAEARSSLERAREIFARLPAPSPLAETEALLDQATALTA